MSLTQTQLDAYEQDGYILLAGLIPDAVATATAAIMWQCMEARPDDPQTWPDGYAQGLDHPAIVACYTENFLHAAAQLCGDPPEAVGKPGSALAINIFPADGEWKQPTPHIDHAIKEHGHKTFPRPFRIATMTFLNDVAERGGGTAVWPGSHRQIEKFASVRSAPASKTPSSWAPLTLTPAACKTCRSVSALGDAGPST